LSKFNIKLIDSINAQEVWKESPNNNIFNNPSFLSHFKNCKIYSLKKGDEILCCWPIIDNTSKMEIPDFFYYFGPYWSKNAYKLPLHSWLSNSKGVYEKFLDYYTKKFTDINFQLHYSLTDTRIFDWWNFGKKNQKKFTVMPKYTAILENINEKNIKDISADYRYVRRYEIKNFAKHLSKISKHDANFEEIFDLYIKNYNLDESNENIKKYEKSLLNIFNLAKKKFGKVTSFKETSSNSLIYCAITLNDHKSTNLVINCASYKWKKEGLMAWAINELINESKNNCNLFDFNGANSPQRGDDKHSYGAKEKLYFQLKY